MNNQITLIGHVSNEPVSKSSGDTGNKVTLKEYSSNSDERKTLRLEVDAWNSLGDMEFSRLLRKAGKCCSIAGLLLRPQE